jgi:hypothetical protein
MKQVQHGKLAERAPQFWNKHVFAPWRVLVLPHTPKNSTDHFDRLPSNSLLQLGQLCVHLGQEKVAAEARGGGAVGVDCAHDVFAYTTYFLHALLFATRKKNYLVVCTRPVRLLLCKCALDLEHGCHKTVADAARHTAQYVPM